MADDAFMNPELPASLRDLDEDEHRASEAGVRNLRGDEREYVEDAGDKFTDGTQRLARQTLCKPMRGDKEHASAHFGRNDGVSSARSGGVQSA